MQQSENRRALDILQKLAEAGIEPPDDETPRPSFLLVDDEQQTLVYFGTFMEKRSTVYIADCAECAMNQLAEHDDIGVLITDIRMPGKGGEWLIDQTRRLYPWVKIIAMSAYSENQERIKEKTDSWCNKPIRIERLINEASILAASA